MTKKKFLEVLSNVSFDWNKIILRFGVYTTEKDTYTVDGENITWDIMPQFPSCQGFDPREYFELDTNTPLQIFIDVAKVENMGVTFYFEDSNKALRRKQKSSILSYMGPSFKNLDLNKTMYMEGIFQVSQTINSDEDLSKSCKNYPYNGLESYKDCDEQYIYQLFSKQYQLMPPWVSRYIDEVTISRLK